MKPVHIGCSGWNYRDWRGGLYPAGVPARRWLECYAERFGTVEVNATFYRLATSATVEHWVEQTPEHFTFAVKASRYLTHVRRLNDIAQGLRRFFDPLEPLRRAGRLGPVLWQLPETFKRDDGVLAGLLDQLPDGRHALEVRHPSWFADDVYALLRSHDVALVLGDHPQRPFQTHQATASWRYVRLHYGARGRRGNYSDTELDKWAHQLHRWRATREVFLYLNNDWEGFAPNNALWLKRRLARLAAKR
ncbi:MAG TPA: DUF72 domain-containing protein [Solirubrobacteraceae bacterium]|nr:DUF72 domain-containing protein [Solirubrobacteraceae bacterium]